MAGTYTLTDKVDPYIESLIENDHDHYHLKMCGATVAVLFFTGEEGAPLMCQGYPAAAMIKKTTAKERALGQRDAIMIIDRAYWIEHEEDQKALFALVDHELMHLAPVIKEWRHAKENPKDPKSGYLYIDGELAKQSAIYEYDDHHRPKLRMRKHDIEVGWFLRCAEKWKDASGGEVVQAMSIRETCGQLLFGLMATETEKQATIMRERTRAQNLPYDIEDPLEPLRPRRRPQGKKDNV